MYSLKLYFGCTCNPEICGLRISLLPILKKLRCVKFFKLGCPPPNVVKSRHNVSSFDNLLKSGAHFNLQSTNTSLVNFSDIGNSNLSVLNQRHCKSKSKHCKLNIVTKYCESKIL